MSYDSTEDTKRHINRVRELLGQFADNLLMRSARHDASKLEEPERSGFDRIGEHLHGLTYGSEAYKAVLRVEAPTIQHHYEKNDHHPEHYAPRVGGDGAPGDELAWMNDLELLRRDIVLIEALIPDGGGALWRTAQRLKELLAVEESRVNQMSLTAVVEMITDWRAASERHATGSIVASLEINRKRFGLSRQLVRIFANTLKELEW